MRSVLLLLVLLFGRVTFATAADEDLIHWRQSGSPDGRTLVLIPGLMSDGAVFDDVLADFRESARIEQATLRGFAGVPAASDMSAVIDPAARAAIRHLRDSGASHAILVGHSIGGQIVLRMARLAPDLVESVIVIDSLPYLAALYRPQLDPADAAAEAEAMAASFAALPADMFEAYQRQSARIMAKSAARQQQILGWSLASDRMTASTAIREVFGSDWRADMATVAAPVTVLAAHDAMMPLSRDGIAEIYRAQYAGLPSLKLVIVDESYHFIMFDRPDAVIAAIAERLEVRP